MNVRLQKSNNPEYIFLPCYVIYIVLLLGIIRTSGQLGRLL